MDSVKENLINIKFKHFSLIIMMCVYKQQTCSVITIASNMDTCCKIIREIMKHFDKVSLKLYINLNFTTAFILWVNERNYLGQSKTNYVCCFYAFIQFEYITTDTQHVSRNPQSRVFNNYRMEMNFPSSLSLFLCFFKVSHKSTHEWRP